MNKFFKIVDKIALAIAYIGVVLIVLLALMYLTDVLGRLLISRQIKGTYEVAQFFLCAISFSAYGYTQVKRGHIHVGFLVNNFSKRSKYIVYAFDFTICTIMCIITVYALWRTGNFALSTGKSTAVLEIPLYPLYYLNAIFMSVFTLTIITDIIRSFLAFFGNPEAQESMDRVCL